MPPWPPCSNCRPSLASTPVRVLLSFENFAWFGGTESYTLTVAMELQRLGHEVAIYSPNHGAMAEFARRQGVSIVSSRELPASSDLLICSDAATCHELAPRYGDAVRLFVVHSVDFMLQAPPQQRDRCQAVVVLNDRVRRAVEARAWHAPIVRLRQPIDLRRFAGIARTASNSRTALVLGNVVSPSGAKLIEDACRANGLNVEWVGARTQPTPTPELAIARARLVIGLGRSVLEGMAGGRAAYVYGIVGGDGWVTPERYPLMEADGFAGSPWNFQTSSARRSVSCTTSSTSGRLWMPKTRIRAATNRPDSCRKRCSVRSTTFS